MKKFIVACFAIALFFEAFACVSAEAQLLGRRRCCRPQRCCRQVSCCNNTHSCCDSARSCCNNTRSCCDSARSCCDSAPANDCGCGGVAQVSYGTQAGYIAPASYQVAPASDCGCGAATPMSYESSPMSYEAAPMSYESAPAGCINCGAQNSTSGGGQIIFDGQPTLATEGGIVSEGVVNTEGISSGETFVSEQIISEEVIEAPADGAETPVSAPAEDSVPDAPAATGDDA